jgi:hypothetical protein
MKTLVRALMFTAWLLYGYMPAQAAMSLPAPVTTEDHAVMQMPMPEMAMQPMGHGTAKPASQGLKSGNGDPCPHEGQMSHSAFCAGCLTLLPHLSFAGSGRLLFSYPAPDLAKPFLDAALSPPTPPPRA